MEDVTLDMRGALQLRINGVLTDQPLQVTIQNIRLDLDALLEQGGFRVKRASSFAILPGFFHKKGLKHPKIDNFRHIFALTCLEFAARLLAVQVQWFLPRHCILIEKARLGRHVAPEQSTGDQPSMVSKRVILMLCTGDTCRGPMAAGYLRRRSACNFPT